MNSRNHIRLVWDRTKTSGPCVLVLGMFDGVHEGHRELIRTAGREAEERNVPLQVCTFMPHPLQVLRPESAPRMLSTLAEKTESWESTRYGGSVSQRSLPQCPRRFS